MGATYNTEGHSFCIASVSSIESVGCVPIPILTPPAVVAPGSIIRRLLPMLDICSSIFWLAPLPTASIVMTALTPITIPSIVRADRILFTLKDLKEIFIVEGILIIVFQGNYRIFRQDLQDKRD